MANYELWYCDPVGNRIEPMQDIAAFEYVQTVGDAGYFTCAVPRSGKAYTRTRPYYRVHIYRQPDGGTLGLEMHAFLRRFVYRTDDNGMEEVQIQGGDGNSLIPQRILGYRVGTNSMEQSTSGADERMKYLVQLSFGILADFDYDGGADVRDLTNYGFSVQLDRDLGPVVNDAAAWKNVLAALKNVQTKSKTAGTEVFFNVVPLTDTTMEFRHYIGQPGQDRSLSGVSPIVASLSNGNLVHPVLDIDYNNAITRVYAGGQGQDTANVGDRIVEVAIDTDLEGMSPFARSEQFYNATRYETSASVQDAADEQLALKRPQRKFTGLLIDTPQTPYGGNGWKLGDVVIVEYMDYQFDCMIRSVKVRKSRDGLETVTGRLESRDIEVFI